MTLSIVPLGQRINWNPGFYLLTFNQALDPTVTTYSGSVYATDMANAAASGSNIKGYAFFANWAWFSNAQGVYTNILNNGTSFFASLMADAVAKNQKIIVQFNPGDFAHGAYVPTSSRYIPNYILTGSTYGAANQGNTGLTASSPYLYGYYQCANGGPTANWVGNNNVYNAMLADIQQFAAIWDGNANLEAFVMCADDVMYPNSGTGLTGASYFTTLQSLMLAVKSYFKYTNVALQMAGAQFTAGQSYVQALVQAGVLVSRSDIEGYQSWDNTAVAFTFTGIPNGTSATIASGLNPNVWPGNTYSCKITSTGQVVSMTVPSSGVVTFSPAVTGATTNAASCNQAWPRMGPAMQAWANIQSPGSSWSPPTPTLQSYSTSIMFAEEGDFTDATGTSHVGIPSTGAQMARACNDTVTGGVGWHASHMLISYSNSTTWANRTTNASNGAFGTPITNTAYPSIYPGSVSATTGSMASFRLLARSGTAPYTWSLASSTGTNVWYVTPDGWLYGAPTTAETDTVTVNLTDAASGNASTTITITVGTSLVLAGVDPISGNLNLPSIRVGSSYSLKLGAYGGTSPYTYSIVSGALPAGLTLSSGVISGTSTVAGNPTCTIKVTDNASHSAQAPIAMNVAGADTATRPAGNTGTGYFVANGKFYDPTGHRFQIRGMNRVHFDGASWTGGVNGVLTGCNTARIFTYNVGSNTGFNTGSAFLDVLTNQSISNGLLPILTVNNIPNTATGTSGDVSATDLASVVTWWVANVSTFTPYMNQMAINIANEWGPSNSSTWQTSYQTAVGNLRTAGYTCPIFIDAGGSGQDAAGLINFASSVQQSDPQKNCVFSLHLYGSVTPTTYQSVINSLVPLQSQGVCVIIGEFGPGRNIGPSPTLTSINEIIGAAEGAGLGWLYWAEDDHDNADGSSSNSWFGISNQPNIGAGGWTGVPSGLTEQGQDVVLNPRYGVRSLAMLPSLPAFDFYISPTGSDSNSGTLAAPWAITAINTKRATYAGKRIGLLDGTYSVYSLVQAAGSYLNSALLVQGGTASNPTVIQAVNPRKAILDAHQTPGQTGAGYPTANAGIIGVGQGDGATLQGIGNIIIDGLVCTGSVDYCVHFFCKSSNTQTVSGGNYNGQQYGGATGIVVRNCEIYDVGSLSFGDNPCAIGLSYTTGALIHNCVVHPMLTSSAQQCQGFLTFNTYQTTVQYCTIYSCGSAIEEKEGPQGSSTYQYNYFEGFDFVGLGSVRDAVGGLPGWTTTFHHNIVTSASGDGWGTGDSTNPGQYTQVSILCYNNTFYDTAQWVTGGFISNNWGTGNSTSPAAALTHYNNIYYPVANGTSGSDVLLASGPGCMALSDYNCFRPSINVNAMLYSRPAGGGTLTGHTLATWRTAFSIDAHSFGANPSMVNPIIAGSAGGTPSPVGFQLNAGSACLGAGRIGGVSTGAATNIGAWDGTVTQIGANFTAGH